MLLISRKDGQRQMTWNSGPSGAYAVKVFGVPDSGFTLHPNTEDQQRS